MAVDKFIHPDACSSTDPDVECTVEHGSDVERYTRGTFTDHATVGHKDGSLVMRKHIVRTVVPGTNVSLLSNASKMPSLSFSLPAGDSCPWALYGEGTICGDCYAQKGRYVMPFVANAQHARFDWVRHCLKTADGTDAFVSVMTQAITDAGNTYFRGHDSGDMFSPAYVRAWVRVCAALPSVRFWFPTRSWRALTIKTLSSTTRDAWALALSELASLPNVVLRPSALFFNAPAPRVGALIAGVAAGTTARDEGFSCPAANQGNVCGACRVCWDAPDVEVSYHRH